MSITPVPRIAIIVVAAGSGTRLGATAPKAFVGIDRHTVLRHALEGVFAAPSAQVIVVAPAGREGDALTELLAASGDRRDLASVVVGGATRQESVAAGLAAVWPDVEFVLVHDAARALTPPDVFGRVLDALADGVPAVVPTLPVVDTLKQVSGSDVVAAVDRSQLAAAQTPQGFARVVIDSAYAVADREYTDDAALVAAAGRAVAIVPGDTRSFKITTPDDLDRARALVAPSTASHAALEHSVPIPRVGIGTDVHAFAAAGTLWLAGLEWPGEPALSGHSDGDVVAHAIVDAILSAAGQGDIGTHFGTDRPEYSGAHAEAFLARTAAIVGEAGWRIGNVAVQFQATRPRFAGRRAEAEAALSAALGGAPVSVSATTTDGLGFPGRGEGVAAFATALVFPV
ncbi:MULTISPECIES: 2-C-methyl-D-erythritol 4-phosphate cytidylyltransferase [Microbacterium]|uniref:Bifunctional enzyme IspD/IspF n=1 Tax=Microbacterium wangchenii TaxID=2541726 RepID=A0ABX5STP2_9MICO|nr:MULTISPECIES: 2-C-methyl-D-erythritol 4-phosphate cytidylyltransferase [Microbacterium]MCK6067517.1 2-C-methyl-D-erythritol 4-phosphate cytidylyltransferase [Microbacterium sp. EYE_512]QBR89553.1 2-C-methyl-D-erythritol 2,4-cyclodiphosphate synthase [Microbacterium wangchenii]TXK16849.1 2-C-methyl-D-erythritol 2,4-cyclodiphosphate synthase [Microbacterium wangchenii]